jgi:hypothetical protein
MALATALCRESLARSERVHSSSAATSGALLERRAASRSSAVTPLISRSMSKMASMRLTASSAIGEIDAAFLLRLALAATSRIPHSVRKRPIH